MTTRDDEDTLLRSVALQNASSILMARQRAEQRLEAYLADAQRLSHTGSFGWVVSTGEIHWSEETFRIFQYDRTSTPTVERLLQRVHPDDATLVKQTIERASRDGKDFEHEFRLVMPDSSVKCVHVVAHAFSDEVGTIEFVGAVMDVTAAKEAEERIRHNEKELRITIETIPAFVVSCLPDGEIEFVSQSWLNYTGCSEEELLDWGWMNIVHPEDRDSVRNNWLAALATGEAVEQEVRCRRADGQYRWFLERAVPRRDEKGQVVKWYATLHDIEDRKRAAEALREAQADLARVNRVNTMGELTASLAHEVNQPLAAVVTSGRTCQRWLAGETPNIDKARAAAARIVEDGTRAADIISRMRLLFTKGNAQRELVDVNELIREMIVLLRNEATQHAVSVRTELAADLPAVMGDRVQLQQVLMNLIMNGVDAMKDVDGARELAITSRRADAAQLLVSVSDTGVGLPTQQTDQMFKAFFTTKRHGTGMGLSISRSIVESHGGRLWAANNAPRGACFSLSLPTSVEAHG